MKNIEIKARIEDFSTLTKKLLKHGAVLTERLHQVDTYFKVPKGRLKLRELGKNDAHIIFYDRGEKTTERWSNFWTADVMAQRDLKDVLTRTLGVKVVVDKKRTLYMYKNARIHIDTVKDLGKFIEIEALVSKGEKQSQDLMRELLEVLEIPKKDFIKKSYSDLILKK